MTREERWSPGDEPEDGETVALPGEKADRSSDVGHAQSRVLTHTHTHTSSSVRGRLMFCSQGQSVHRGVRVQLLKQPHFISAPKTPAETPPPQQGAPPCF